MPHIVDFDKLKDVKTIQVHPKGWVDLFIEYGFDLRYNIPSYFWRIKGTKHTFIIPISRFYFLSAGTPEKHFNEALEGFRNDYMEWKEDDFSVAEWQMDYKKEYEKFIL
jgi:hypothetical protein